MAALVGRCLVPLDELGEHLGTEQLDRLHDVLMSVVTGLHDEDELVDARFLVRLRNSRSWAGVPTAPRRPVWSPAAALAPRVSRLAARAASGE